MAGIRHSRQTRLDEIGEAGQARIEAASAVVRGDGLASILTARYLAGAGVRTIACASDGAANAARSVDSTVHIAIAFPSDDAEAPDFELRDESAREVARGAWRALDVVRRAIELR